MNSVSFYYKSYNEYLPACLHVIISLRPFSQDLSSFQNYYANPRAKGKKPTEKEGMRLGVAGLYLLESSLARAYSVASLQ